MLQKRIGERVSMYHPDPRRNGLIKGRIIGGGFTTSGLFYVVALDVKFQGYLHKDTAYEQFISAVVVAAGSVFNST